MHPLRTLTSADLEAYDRVLRNAARRLSDCGHFAEEVTQEVWLEALRHPPRHLENLGAWLRVAASRAAARLWRREANGRHREFETARSDGTPSFEEHIEQEVLRSRVRRALGGLRAPYDEVVELHVERGLSGTDIGLLLGRSENTVRSQLRRGLLLLRKELRDYEEEGAWPMIWLALLLGRPVRQAPALAASGLVAVAVVTSCALWMSRSGVDPTAALPSRATLAATDGAERPPPSARAEGPSLRQPAPVERADSSAAIRGEREVLRSSARADLLAVSGRVLRRGEPRAGAEIWAADASTPRRGRVVARADERGAFSVEGLDARDWIWADAPRVTASNRYQVGTISGERRGAFQLELRRPLGRLVLTVRDAGGAPVAGATVHFHVRPQLRRWGESGSLELPPVCPAVRTDSAGSAETDQPAWSNCSVVVESEGRAWHIEPRAFEDRGRDGRLDLTLPAPVRLGGRVLGSDGTPVAGARVRLADARGLPPIEATSDERGRYELPGFTARDATVIASSPGGSARVTLATAPGEVHRLDLWLGDDHALVGRAFRAHLPLSEWTVEAWPLPLRPGTVPTVAVTGPAGGFRLDGVDARRHALLLFAPDGSVPQLRREVAPGWSGALDVAAEGPTHALRGALATPLAGGSWLELSGEGLPRGLVVPCDGRTFALEGLLAGDYTLRALVPSNGPIVLATPDLERGQDVDLGTLEIPAPAKLTVIAIPPDGGEVEFLESGLFGGTLHLVGSSAAGATTKLEYGANVQVFKDVPAGDYALKIRMRDHATHWTEVRIRRGESQVVTIEPGPGVTATVRFELAEPLPEGETLHVRGRSDGRPLGLLEQPRLGNGVRRAWLTHMEWPVGALELEAWTSTGRRGSLHCSLGPDDDGQSIALALD
jgi:RNA polymerase sigma factor (sigma-70 family)